MSSLSTDKLACPTCGADRHYRAADGQGALHCNFCQGQGEEQPQPVVRGIQEIDLEELVAQENVLPPQALGEHTTGCQSCGAQTSHAAALKSMVCPFCASNLIRDQKDNPATFQPHGIIPFSVTPEAASKAIRGWASSLWLRPNKVQALSRPSEIRGVYIPFWTIDCRSQSEYRGHVKRYEEREQWDSFLFIPYKKESKTVLVDDPVDGTRRAQYDDVLVSASLGLPLEQTREIEPFHTITKLLPYQSKYLAGCAAEESLVGPSEAWKKAEEHLRRVEYRNAVKEVTRSPGDTVEIDVHYRFYQRTGKPVLLPVYVAAYRYAGKSYRVLVNGETGQVWGQAPYSYLKIAALVLILLPLLTAFTVATAGTDLLFLVAIYTAHWLYRKSQGARREERNVLASPSRYDPPKKKGR